VCLGIFHSDFLSTAFAINGVVLAAGNITAYTGIAAAGFLITHIYASISYLRP
jgi:hypothetical protein